MYQMLYKLIELSGDAKGTLGVVYRAYYINLMEVV